MSRIFFLTLDPALDKLRETHIFDTKETTMSFSPKEYAQRNLESISDRVAESADAVRRGPMTVRELLDHPERIAELNPNGQTLQDAVNAAEAAEDDYYAQLGAEIEQHPICSPHLILQRQGRNGS